MRPSRYRVAAVVAGALLLALLAPPRRAVAYPQFQLSSGTVRCSQCHYSPTGGTLITQWGRDESAETISMGGNGGFLHGAVSLPSWLALGADVRLAAIRNDVGGPEAPEVAAFPMQFDVYGRLAYDAFSLNLTLGDRGVVRPTDPSIGGRLSDTTARVVSREHYLMWRPSASGAYVRLGRFDAPYGIHFAEHIYFVRRYTGFDLYEETYNVSGGYLGEDWEVHGTAFMHPPASPDLIAGVGPHENGGAAYGEKRFMDMAALALQARVGIASNESRYQAGGVGKLWIQPARLLLLGEADLIRLQVTKASAAENQFVSYLGATYFIRGFMAGLAYERFQEDLSVAGTGRNAYDVEVNFFPWAHFEFVLLGRYQKAGAGAMGDSSAASLGMLQLHYYL
jgi:hypothetical protein